MSTLVKLGPADHGRPIALEDFQTGNYQEGYHYELIAGKLYVSPEANLPENWVEQWLLRKVQNYASSHPQVINFVTNKARVFVPRRRRLTIPEPDLAAYRDFPLHLPLRQLRWQDVSPVLVGEILSFEDPNKDLVRNMELYWQVPTIKEYWLVDTREDPDRPTMQVYRRRVRKWGVVDVNFQDVYTTPLLPGFQLLLDPRT